MTVPLHLVQSPAGLDRCLRRATEKAALLLLEDGVYSAMTTPNIPPGPLTLYALVEDLAARGLSPADLAPGIVALDMKGFVALTVAHSPIISWF